MAKNFFSDYTNAMLENEKHRMIVQQAIGWQKAAAHEFVTVQSRIDLGFSLGAIVYQQERAAKAYQRARAMMAILMR